MIITSKFKPGDSVMILTPKIKADVVSIHVSGSLTVTYLCEWWDDNTPDSKYFYSHQLEPYSKEKHEPNMIVVPEGVKKPQ